MASWPSAAKHVTFEWNIYDERIMIYIKHIFQAFHDIYFIWKNNNDHIWIYFIFHDICGGQHAYFPCLAKESKEI